MNTNTIHHCRIASSAAATLIATGTVLAAQLGAAAPATAKYDNYYVAIAVGDLNDAPPVQTVAGLMIGPDEGQTDQKALSNCVGGGGRQCVVEISVENTCAAVASNDFGEFGTASDPTLQVAKNNAETKLANKQGVHVVEAYCSEGPDQLPPPRPTGAGSHGCKAGADGIVQSDRGRSRGPHHRPQRGGVAVHLCDGQRQSQFRARRQRQLRPQDRSGDPAVQGRERDHQVRQRNQHSDHREVLSGSASHTG